MSQVVVSQQAGYARNASESAYPNLWRGLDIWVCPSINPRGLTLYDLGPGRKNGTLENVLASAWGVSQGGGYLALNRASTRDCVNFGNVGHQANDFTVCGWVYKLSTTTSFSNIWFINRWQTGAGGQNEFLLSCGQAFGTGNGDIPSFTIVVSGISYTAASVTNLSLNKWQHICGVRRGSVVQFYLDGKTEATTNATATAISKFSRNLKIGDSDIGSDLSNNIYVDDLRIYNRALAPTEIALLASRRRIGLEPRFDRQAYEQVAAGIANPVLFYNHYVNQGFF
jgi:hypothetical protein